VTRPAEGAAGSAFNALKKPLSSSKVGQRDEGGRYSSQTGAKRGREDESNPSPLYAGTKFVMKLIILFNSYQ
jgi:hypothetical protein